MEGLKIKHNEIYRKSIQFHFNEMKTPNAVMLAGRVPVDVQRTVFRSDSALSL